MVFSQSLKQEFSDAIAMDNKALQKKIAIDLHTSYSSFTYAYFEILLNSLPKNAILITNALDDTFPLKILQVNKNTRTDVALVSIEMLQDSNYVNSINKSYKLQLTNDATTNQVQKVF